MKFGQVTIHRETIPGQVGNKQKTNQDRTHAFSVPIPRKVQTILKQIKDKEIKNNLLTTAIKQGVLALGEKIDKDTKVYSSGATLTLCAAFREEKGITVVTAQLGDSEGMLISKWASAIKSTVNHNKKNKAEKNRIEKAGGKWDDAHATFMAEQDFDLVESEEPAILNKSPKPIKVYLTCSNNPPPDRLVCKVFLNEKLYGENSIELAKIAEHLEDRFISFKTALDNKNLPELNAYLYDLWVIFGKENNSLQICTTGLSPTRSLGDLRNRLASHGRGILRIPEMQVWEVSPGTELFLGTDGFFEGLRFYWSTLEDAVHFRWDRFNKKLEGLSEVAQGLWNRELQGRPGHIDDISAIWTENLEQQDENTLLVTIALDGHGSFGHEVAQMGVDSSKACIEQALEQVFFSYDYEKLFSHLTCAEQKTEFSTIPNVSRKSPGVLDKDLFVPIAGLLKLISGLNVLFKNEGNTITCSFTCARHFQAESPFQFFSLDAQLKENAENYEQLKLFMKRIHYYDHAVTLVETIQARPRDKNYGVLCTTTVEILDWFVFERYLIKEIENYYLALIKTVMASNNYPEKATNIVTEYLRPVI